MRSSLVVVAELASALAEGPQRLCDAYLNAGMAYGTFALNHLDVQMWQQIWSDTSMGRGAGGQAMTSAHTIAIHDDETGGWAVFHGGRFDYVVVRPTERFMELVVQHRLPAIRSAELDRAEFAA